MGGRALLLPLLLSGLCAAQYEEYSVRGFPAAALEPLQAAYARALAQYADAQWAESARELEASLRLHRLLRDSEAHCHRRCSAPAEGGGNREGEEGDPAEAEPAVWEWQREMQLFGRLLRRAGCLRACKRDLPVFQLRYPPAQTLRDFQRRLPYQYLHYALFKVRRPRKCGATWRGGEWRAPSASILHHSEPSPAPSSTLRPVPFHSAPTTEPTPILHPCPVPSSCALCPIAPDTSRLQPRSLHLHPVPLHHQFAPLGLHPLNPIPLYPAPWCHVVPCPAPLPSPTAHPVLPFSRCLSINSSILPLPRGTSPAAGMHQAGREGCT